MRVARVIGNLITTEKHQVRQSLGMQRRIGHGGGRCATGTEQRHARRTLRADHRVQFLDQRVQAQRHLVGR